jgi:hypothetical protein
MTTERKAVANYLREVAEMVEQGVAFDFEFRWGLGRSALANLQVLPVTAEQHIEFDARRFAVIPHIAEVCMAAGSGLYRFNEELRVAESVVSGTIGGS